MKRILVIIRPSLCYNHGRRRRVLGNEYQPEMSLDNYISLAPVAYPFQKPYLRDGAFVFP